MPEVQIPIFGSTDELLLAILQEFFQGQGIHIGTLFSEEIQPPMIIARAERRSGTIGNVVTDDRYLHPAIISVSTITDGVDADEMGEELQEAVRVALRQAHLNQVVVPNGGSIAQITNASMPVRVSDYATSTGIVQYAGLPSGQVRYESIWRLILRSPPQSTITNRFLITPEP